MSKFKVSNSGKKAWDNVTQKNPKHDSQADPNTKITFEYSHFIQPFLTARLVQTIPDVNYDRLNLLAYEYVFLRLKIPCQK